MPNLDAVNLSWLLACAILVVVMQAGFTCLESGMVRAKNSINVAFKNLIDFCIAALLFAALGYGLMFGSDWGGLIGIEPLRFWTLQSPAELAFFFFQMAFCGTATTIVAGAVAERMRFSAYIVTAGVLALLIYPLSGHWIWGGGWLEQLGFIDFAGSTAVHSVGAWVALAALLIVGPRAGRFGPGGKAIEGDNLPVATLGVFLLWVGWFGFNGGSALRLDARVPLIITNTALAAAAGGVAACAASWWLQGRPAVDRVINGVLAGLVAVTAACHLLAPPMAIVVGAVGGVLCVSITHALERRHIDDAVGAVPVHLGAGIWGTLAVALCTPAGSWGSSLSRLELLEVQLLGVGAVAVHAFAVSYLALKIVNRWLPLRVSADDERIGLNIAEHGASSALLDLIVQMDRQARRGDFSSRVEVEPETEAARIAVFYNAVLDKVVLETDRRQMAMKTLAQLANYDSLTGLANRRLFHEALRRAHRRGSCGALFYIDLDNFKRINDRFGHDFGDRLLKAAGASLARCAPEHAVLGRLGGDEFALLIEPLTRVTEAEAMADGLLQSLSTPVDIEGHRFKIEASVGVVWFDGSETDAMGILTRADHAMYHAKLAGKGSWHLHGSVNDDFAPQA